MQQALKNIERNDTLGRSESSAALKARKLAEIRAEMELIANEINPDLRTLRQGIVDGRLFELQELGVFTSQEANGFVQQMQLSLGVKSSAANDLDFIPVRATMDWACVNESNTPRGEVTGIRIEPELIGLIFKGTEAGYGSTWAGSIELKRTVGVQTINGHYEITYDAKVKSLPESVKYTVVGCFSDDSCTSFTGTWTEGPEHVYEFTVDLH
jgi:hypothetical protein